MFCGPLPPHPCVCPPVVNLTHWVYLGDPPPRPWWSPVVLWRILNTPPPSRALFKFPVPERRGVRSICVTAGGAPRLPGVPKGNCLSSSCGRTARGARLRPPATRELSSPDADAQDAPSPVVTAVPVPCAFILSTDKGLFQVTADALCRGGTSEGRDVSSDRRIYLNSLGGAGRGGAVWCDCHAQSAQYSVGVGRSQSTFSRHSLTSGPAHEARFYYSCD